MRQHPQEHADVVSQALFSEQVAVLQNQGEWVYITTPDSYSGWVKDSGICSNLDYTVSHYTSSISVPLYIEKGINKGPILFLPYGVGVCVVACDSDWAQVLLPSGEFLFTQSGYLSSPCIILRENLEKLSRQFLGLPYIWGGRSSFGYDCSGFVQMLYQKMGISLPRDACEQINYPYLQEQTVENLSLGDLIFWGSSPKKIGHVGVFLGEGKFIHATARENQPWLRISHLTDLAWRGAETSIYSYRCFRKPCVVG